MRILRSVSGVDIAAAAAALPEQLAAQTHDAADKAILRVLASDISPCLRVADPGLRVEGEVALVAVAAVQGVAETSVDAGIECAGLRLLPEVGLQVVDVILVGLVSEAGAVLLLGGDGVAARRQAA